MDFCPSGLGVTSHHMNTISAVHFQGRYLMSVVPETGPSGLVEMEKNVHPPRLHSETLPAPLQL